MKIELRQLSCSDGIEVYNMLQEMPKDENGFINGCNGKSFDEYRKWLIKSNNSANGIGLEDWMVPETIYWLFFNDIPIGYGKLRHCLTDKLMEKGGHVGYAVLESQRNKGYGTLLLNLLLEKAKEKKIDKILLTVQNHNKPSIKAALNNGGIIEKVNDTRHYIWIGC